MSTCLSAIEIRTSDYIKINGKTFTITNSPLEPYFKLYPEIAPKSDIFFLETNKNYEAVYEFIDSVLYVVEINVSRLAEDSSYKTVNIISEVFNGLHEVKMEWYTTTLIIEPVYLTPEGRKGSFQNDNYIVLQVESGKLKSKKSASLRQVNKLKHSLFKKFTNTKEYGQIKEQYSEWKVEDIEKQIIGDEILEFTAQIDLKKTPHNKK